EPDPLVPESWHPYVFANSNPHLYQDPTGALTLVSFSVADGIQNILQGIRASIVQYTKQQAKEAVGKGVGNLLANFIRGFAPALGQTLDQARAITGVSNASNNGAQGLAFEALLQQAICGELGATARFLRFVFLEPAIAESGEADSDGITCNQRGSIAPRTGFTRDHSFPDFLISPDPPTTLKSTGTKSWLIGDFKINVRNIRGSPRSKRQFSRTAAHAREYGSKVAFWISLKGTEAQAEGVIAAALGNRVLGFVLIIL